MSKQAYKIRDDKGTVIGQYLRYEKPEKPENYDGEWDIKTISKNDLNSEPVEWWDRN